MLLDKRSNIAWRPKMPEQKRLTKQDNDKPENMPPAFFACPNSDCADFNHFNAGNLSVAEWMGKDKAIRRLYCKTCGSRFSERQGSLMQDTKLPQEVVVRIIKCLGHGCSVEATSDICEVDTRTVQRFLENSGKRAADFHRLQLEKLDKPLEAVQMDELHGRTIKNKCDIELVNIPKMLRKRLGKKRAKRGFIRLWR
jgi:LacI family transcriptional regulator